jgi:hypothetical protein
MKSLKVLLFIVIVTCLVSFSKDASGILSPDDKTTSPAQSLEKQDGIFLGSSPKVIQEKKGGKNACTVYEYSYECTGDVFFGSGTIETCVDEFIGNDRIIGIELGTTLDCITSKPNGTNTAGNANCGNFVELYYKNERFKYRVVLSGGVWDNECAPSPGGDPTCLDFHLVDIGHDGKHDRDCLTSGSVDIGPHTICITNLGPGPN